LQANFKAALVKDHALAARARAWETTGAAEIRAEQWGEAFVRCLRQVGKTKTDVRTERKSALWKIAIAAHLKEKTQVSNRWLCEQHRKADCVFPRAVKSYRSRKSGNENLA